MLNFNYKAQLTKTLLRKLTIVSSEKNLLETVIKKKVDTVASPFVISFVNAHCMNLAHKSPRFNIALFGSDIVLRDGIGIKILLKLFGFEFGFNANGTDFIPKYLEEIKGQKIALLGTSDERVRQASLRLREEGHKIVLVDNGFHESQHYIELIQNTDADVIVLGMGMPKQELLANEIKLKIRKEITIINGGAIIDFLSNLTNRAPKFYRKYGLEWTYRLYKEPRRLMRRYILGNVFFLIRGVFHAFIYHFNK
jgi:exopolysaccharide biosynthesis WecB/TagA/CpsF family protein